MPARPLLLSWLVAGALGCAHRKPADAGAPVPENADSSSAPAAAAPEAVELPGWLREVLPALRAQDWSGADAVLSEALARAELTPQERTLALWYRASVRAQTGDRDGELADLRSFVSSSQALDLKGDGPGALLQHRVGLAQLAIAAEDTVADPTIGSSPERSLAVMLSSDEYFYVGRLSCGPGLAAGYTVDNQTLINDERGVFDLLEIHCDADGATRQVWFDLEFWWQLLGFSLGANPPPPGLEPEGAKALMQIATQ